MADRKYYVICDAGCKFESMTREQILAAITQAMNEGTVGDIDTGFVTTIKTISGTPLRFFVGTHAEYEALSEADRENLFAIITNDTTKDGILQKLAELESEIESTNERINASTIAGLEGVKTDVKRIEDDLNDVKDGTTAVGKATVAETVEAEESPMAGKMPVWFSHYLGDNKRAYSDNFQYSTDEDTLYVPHIEGNAKTASAVKANTAAMSINISVDDDGMTEVPLWKMSLLEERCLYLVSFDGNVGWMLYKANTYTFYIQLGMYYASLSANVLNGTWSFNFYTDILRTAYDKYVGSGTVYFYKMGIIG